ncbi:MAG: hypothetical protein M1825_001290 [Sarcosagium campestre]|nr:MAG: hypothetical protein M1825_001290 [Sarcosagium campestre]
MASERREQCESLQSGDHANETNQKEQEQRSARIRIKNRRRYYLDRSPGYFSQDLELADPLLYDRCVRRFQSATEREEEGKKKGYSGVLESDLMRSEAKIAALNQPESATTTYRRGPNGEIYPEDPADAPQSKEEGLARWQEEMTQRFLNGADTDFDYVNIDENTDWDDRQLEEREAEEEWFATEEPEWVNGDSTGERSSSTVHGETGIQDY